MRSELAAAFWSGNTTNDIPCFFIDMHMSTGTRVAMRLRSGSYIDRTGPAESEAISRIAELSRQAGDAVRGPKPTGLGRTLVRTPTIPYRAHWALSC